MTGVQTCALPISVRVLRTGAQETGGEEGDVSTAPVTALRTHSYSTSALKNGGEEDEYAKHSEKEGNRVRTYYCCRSEGVSKGLKEGALCNKPNKEVIDSSTGSTLWQLEKERAH